MGQLLTQLWENWGGGKQESRILMVGLDAAGKTTILYNLKLGEVRTTIPTIGFNVESVEYKNLCFNVWDVGGQDKIRPLWRHYYDNADGIIFVVDSADTDRFNLSSEELGRAMQEPSLRGVPLLIFANKQDLPNSVGPTKLASELDLSQSASSSGPRKWHIQACVGTSGEGLFEGLDWLSRAVTEFQQSKQI